MRRAILALSLVVSACEHEPGGRCESALDCLQGQVCSEGVCTSQVAGPTNHAPSATADAYTATTDGVLGVAAAAGLLANDADPDGDALVAERVSPPAHGIAYVAPDGGFVYVPHPGYAGDDVFSYRASDGALRSGVTSVTVTVGP